MRLANNKCSMRIMGHLRGRNGAEGEENVWERLSWPGLVWFGLGTFPCVEIANGRGSTRKNKQIDTFTINLTPLLVFYIPEPVQVLAPKPAPGGKPASQDLFQPKGVLPKSDPDLEPILMQLWFHVGFQICPKLRKQINDNRIKIRNIL